MSTFGSAPTLLLYLFILESVGLTFQQGSPMEKGLKVA